MLTRPAERHSGPVSLPKSALSGLMLATLLAVWAPSAQAQAQDLPPAATEEAAPATDTQAAPQPDAPDSATDGTPQDDAQPADGAATAPEVAQPEDQSAAPVETPAPGTDAPATDTQAAPQPDAPDSATDGAAGSPQDDAQPAQDAATAPGMADDAPAATPAESEAPAAPQPMPSIFDDPAGALNHMLAPPERRDDLPHDLSPWGMFMAADIVVKAVMVGLVFASLVTWTVWLAKVLEIGGARSRAGRMLKLVRSSASLSEAVERAGNKGGPAALMLRAAQEEARMSEAAIDLAGGEGLKERVGSAMNRIEVAAGRRISKGTGVLATIGSTSPFVGLFGTVWGIMNSFIGISEAQTTNLAVVAPGIAEALLATALGLVAAIPAVVVYNICARANASYRARLRDGGALVERLVSRALDAEARRPA